MNHNKFAYFVLDMFHAFIYPIRYKSTACCHSSLLYFLFFSAALYIFNFYFIPSLSHPIQITILNFNTFHITVYSVDYRLFYCNITIHLDKENLEHTGTGGLF